MPDLILRDVEPALLERVKRLADARDCSLEDALLALLNRGLACSNDAGGGFDDSDARVLQEAIAALENVPSDPGFALIGRMAPHSPVPAEVPDQPIVAASMAPR